MTNASPTDTSNKSLTRDLWYAVQYYLGRRRILLLVAAVAIAGGLALNWDWLVAAGLAPILIAILPCAVMCALGMCMHKMSGGSGGTANSASCCATESPPPRQTEARTRNLTAPVSRPTVNQSALECCHEAVDTIAPASAEKSQAMDQKGAPRG